ncbi:hypothetical protein SAMN04488047_12535, partial [Tranquillimonas alkanivorans]
MDGNDIEQTGGCPVKHHTFRGPRNKDW